MTPSFTTELNKLGRTLVWWRAQLKLVLGTAAVLGATLLLGLLDIWLRMGRLGRISAWLMLIAGIGAIIWLVRRTLRYRFSTEGVAAAVEQAFPKLDNHLINYLQFSADTGGNPFKMAYLNEGAPAWNQIQPAEMKNRKLHQRGWMALSAALLLLVIPGFIFGPAAWSTALLRMANPFSNREPISLTKILEVSPGETTVAQGGPVVLTCSVQGMEGHEVQVEIDPRDAKPSSIVLGRISSTKKQQFARHLPQVNTAFRYRFKAGDATPSDWQTVNTRAPSAFTDIQLTIAPPAYTGWKPQTLSAWEKGIHIQQGSVVTVTALCNTPLKTASITTVNDEVTELAATDSPTTWSGSLTLTGGQTLILKAEDIYGSSIEEQLGFALRGDLPPVIEVTAPRGRTMLPPGALPQIAFQATDDFGLRQVMLEQEKTSRDGTRIWVPIKTWNSEKKDTFLQSWRADTGSPAGQPLAYRITASDTCSFASNTASSTIIRFDTQNMADAAKERNELEAKAVAGLSRILELQKKNLLETRRLTGAANVAETEEWNDLTKRQIEIREVTRELLDNPLKPLGKLTETVKKLYVNDLRDVVTVLSGIPTTAPDARSGKAVQAVGLEEKILRQLSAAELAMSKSKIDRRLSGLSAMLAKMVRDQDNNLKATRDLGENGKAPASLVDVQDILAADLTDFKKTCETEAAEISGGDDGLATVMRTLAERCEQEKIRNDIVLAADRLDQNNLSEAVVHQSTSLKKLSALQALLDDVQLQEEDTQREEMLEAAAQAKEKLKKIKDLHERMIESMDQVKAQKDLSEEEEELMEDAYEELVKNTKEALSEVPTDLHIFMDLNVANDLVEDIFVCFQEIEQTEGSEKWGEEKVKDIGFVKEEVMLGLMEEAGERIDEMEHWLEEEPDIDKVTTEAFDQEEMPEGGMALTELPTALEDLISDLVENSEELDEAADDGSTNHAMPDFEAGHKVEEGDLASFSAKGKSGSQRPDHKEQDGRSGVGRQGMSSGETAAGSGTVGAGDENIEERRTSDPTQSGKVDLAGEADTKATGGGKLASGKADDRGMSGGVKRMDSTEEGSWEGMAALMAQRADTLYAQASMKNIRVDSLQEAAHHLRQSADAIATGNMEQVKELKRLAAGALEEARADLSAGPEVAFEVEHSAGLLDGVVEGGPDVAPPRYRDEVAEYFKALNETL